MRIIRFAILIILPLLSLSCLSNKKLISEEKYLQQAEMVLDSFTSYFQDPLVQLKFNRSLHPKQLIETKFTGNFEHGKMSVYDEYSKIYLLKPYVVLNDTEQSFLNTIQEINLRRYNSLGDSSMFTLSPLEKSDLMTIAQEGTYSSAYAKSLLEFLEGEIFDFQPDDDCNEMTEFREVDRVHSNTGNSSIKIFPTPTTDRLNVQLSGISVDDIKNIEIRSLNGLIILDINIQDIEEGIDISSLLSGLYLLKFGLVNGEDMSKLFVKHYADY